MFNQINLNTLKRKDGSFVLNQFDIVTVGNSKDLIAIRQRKAIAGKKDAFLLGFPIMRVRHLRYRDQKWK